MRWTLYINLFLLTLTACTQKQADAPLFQQISPDESGIHFSNLIENSKALNIFNYRNFYNGAGVAIGDINNDGLSDIFFTANTGKNALYLNKGNFKFEDITEQAGVAGSKSWSTGVVMVDVNADGLLDIYVCNAGYFKGDDQKNELFINQMSAAADMPTFKEDAASYQLDLSGYTTHAAFFDYDQDGDLDCYILNNSFMPVNTLNYSNKRELFAENWPVKDFLKGGGDKLLRNEEGQFIDVTKESGIYSSLIGFGLGITVGDVNGDHWPDMYVSNDFFERDYLYINQQDGTFKEEIEQWVEHMSHASMGADMADINNDGYPEIFVTEMLPDDDYRLKTTTLFEDYKVYQEKQSKGFYHQYMQNTLQLNNKDKSFSEIAYYSGVAASDWSWGALMFDADNDGLRDIYICNGIYQDLVDQDFVNFFADEIIQKMVMTGKKEDMSVIIDKMPSNPQKNKAYRNNGDLTFEDMGADWGFDTPSFSNGAAYADLDNDGDLDLVVNNLNMESFVFRNNASAQLNHHYLSVQLKGDDLNPFAIGSKVYLYRNGLIQNAELIPTRGFQSSIDYKIIFGLDSLTSADSLIVQWPDGKTSRLLNPPADTLIHIAYQTAETSNFVLSPTEPNAQTMLEEIESPFPVLTEDAFVDFYAEGLTMRKISREGPVAAIGDINGDGTDDIVLGTPSGTPLLVYLQKEGSFELSPNSNLLKETNFEDTALALFDVDGDGDLDLFAGSGGNHKSVGARELQDRLYLNDGSGHFVLDIRAIPMNGFNTSVALPFDYDQDGDKDLFVGTRSMPGKYGIPSIHLIYENNGTGSFSNNTDKVAPDFITLGMLTDAVLSDINGDGQQELIVVGEWNAPTIFDYQSGIFEKVPNNLSQYPGWWYAVESTDIDGDGDADLLLGNRGENFYFTADESRPAKLWVNDYDKNGTVEKIITQTINGKDMPVPMKKELTDQLTILKKQNLKHAEYAQKSIQELFDPQILKKSLSWKATYFKSSVAINDGNGNFTMQALPKEVQFSCVCDINCSDLNQDGHVDLILAGNDSGFTPQYSKLDASFGHVLLGNGDGSFQRIENTKTGFFVKGDVRALNTFKIENQAHLLVMMNNDQPRLFKYIN